MLIKERDKRTLQIASNHSFDIDFKDFMKLYKDYIKKPYSFSVNDASENHQKIHYDLGRTYYKIDYK